MTKETEKLVKRAYDGIVPPHYVAEELADSLPEKRSRPRGPLAAKILWPVAAAAALGILFLKPPADEPAGERAAALDGSKKVDQPLKVRHLRVVDIKLDVDGTILVPSRIKENREIEVSLDGLADYLDSAIRDFDAARKRNGESGFEELPNGMKVPRVQIVLHAGADVPWRHVQWIMMVCAEQKCRNLLFAEGQKMVDASLPVDRGIQEKPKTSYRVKVRMRTKGQDILYSFPNTDFETKDRAVVAQKIAEAPKPKGAEVKGILHADAHVPYRDVVALMELFRKGGLAQIEFYGCPLPTREQRVAKRLAALAALEFGTRDPVKVQDPRKAKIVEKFEEEILVEGEILEEVEEVPEEEIVEEPIEPKKKKDPAEPK